MKLIIKSSIYPFIAAAITCLDLFTKYLIKNTFDDSGQSVEIAGNYIRFTLIYNKGITFGLFNMVKSSLMPVFLVILAILALTVVVYLYINISHSFKGQIPGILGKIALMFIIGGAMGNIIDRLLNKAVVDFIDVGIGNHRWYTFNTADSFVVIGGIILGILFLFFENKSIEPNQL